MADAKFYVICKNNCKYESMTKEQIIAAIAEATGKTPTNIDDAFITKIKDQNKGGVIKVWSGTVAEYNAITERDDDTVYIKTDDTHDADVDAAIKALGAELENLYARGLATNIEITNGATTFDVAAFDYFVLENNYGSGVISVTLDNIERTSTTICAEGGYKHLSGNAGVSEYDYSVKFTKTDTGYTVAAKYRYNDGAWDDVAYTSIYGYKVGVYSGLGTGNGAGDGTGEAVASGVGIESIKQTVTSTVDGGDNEITVTLTNGNKSKFTVKNGKTGKTAYQYAKDGGYTGTEADFIKTLAGEVIPDYWNGAFTDSAGNTYTKYLDEKIATIKALQDEGGAGCFSFIVISDIHYESNLGKRTPSIARRIMDECGIKFALCLGDMQTRHGGKYDENYIESEWANIEEMLSPIRERLLATQGNHDGSYGWFDLNDDGLINDDVNGDGVANSYDKDVHNYTPQKLYERIFRKVSNIDNVHFSEDGRGYYVDDTGNKVRYIILNSHVNKWELNDNGSIKYNNMYNFRFGQDQYDMVVNALSSIPSDSWSVVCGSHVPLDRSGEYVAWGGEVDANGAQTGNPADCVVMMRLLNAYVRKGTYTGTFGTANPSVPITTEVTTGETTENFTNLVDTSSSDFKDGYRFNKDDGTDHIPQADSDYFMSNYIPATFNKSNPDVLRILAESKDDLSIEMLDSSKNPVGNVISVEATRYDADFVLENGVISWNVGQFESYMSSSSYSNIAYIRFSMPKASLSSKGAIATVNEPITWVTTEGGGTEGDGTEGDGTEGGGTVASYDSVTVNADFTNAKGTLISYHGGHVHKDTVWNRSYNWNGAELSSFYIISTRCDGAEENETELKEERKVGTITEQSFDVFTVNKHTRKIHATKIGAGVDRVIEY